VVVGQAFGKEFERHEAVEASVLGFVNYAHVPPPRRSTI
jgi:hypothetical protein